ncbi:MAG: phosphotransferase [Lysobacterales bacterium]
MSLPDLSSVEQFLRTHYELSGRVELLPGERDHNLRVFSNRGDFVFKIMHPGCDPSLVDLQIQALAHLHREMPRAQVPKVLKTPAGNSTVTFDDPVAGHRLGWLISLLPGDLMANQRPWRSSTAASVGCTLGQLNQALASFKHPCLDRHYEWDLRQSQWLRERSKALSNTPDRELVERVADHFDQTLSAQLDDLERAAIHGDGNDMNILLDPSPDGDCRVCGVIDFGDMVATPRVCEPAIAAAYVMMGEDEEEEVRVERCVALIQAYHQAYPLAADELALLPALVRLRWAVSVTNAAHNAQVNPDNVYLGVSGGDALALLRQFAHTIDALLRPTIEGLTTPLNDSTRQHADSGGL